MLFEHFMGRDAFLLMVTPGYSEKIQVPPIGVESSDIYLRFFTTEL